MTGPRIALVHALPDSVEPANTAFRQEWPEAWVFNVLDDALARDQAAAGGQTTMEINSRIIDLARYAYAAGAKGILYTCSAFGRSIVTASKLVPVPILRPNEAAVDAALDAGPRIALLATFEPTVGMMKAEVEAAAKQRNVTPSVDSRMVPGALAALQSGDAATHDRLIAEAADALPEVDVVVLAQFSMTRAAPSIKGRNVVTTPGSAIARLRKVLGA
jgi:hypothetical protein